ncbi:hypothetical protein EC9_04240 [Rosistilla ulvae]|uniref:DUF423 domain-containing protein n=1 Tax=Rosistilla ulvae TaxID=1930277 RepID=A0A517LUF7_9BACT|nr:DUF423 domain-containing protein [Rosistilla ulvae]QDS86264.1 hypothetical protein EC9_04240 [Rosistilla ulvae]
MNANQASGIAVRRVLMIAGLLGASGIMAGAFTAHGLETWLIDQGYEEVAAKRVGQADVGVRYHLLHAVALVAMAAVAGHYNRGKYLTIITLMTLGTLLFSGSLYLLVALNLPVMGAITPLGGLAWIAAWIMVALPRKSND